MGIDLHCHTTASDGTLSATELVERAASLGLTAVAVTDHDSVASVEEALAAGRRFGLKVIPGVELSAKSDPLDLHVLGYFIDHTHPPLLERLRVLRDSRLRRARDMVAMIDEAGYPLTIGDVAAFAGGEAVGRSHIARALVARGHAEDMRDVFVRFVGRGARFYIPKPVPPPDEVIALIADAGGIAVLAHPGVERADELIPSLTEAGLGGLEAYHSDHDAPTARRYVRLAADLGLVATGGSDYHGPREMHHELGVPRVPEEVLADLEEAWLRSRGR